jgi:hypothetical protein
MTSLSGTTKSNFNIKSTGLDLEGHIEYEIDAKEIKHEVGENAGENKKNVEYKIKVNLELGGATSLDLLNDQIGGLKRIINKIENLREIRS